METPIDGMNFPADQQTSKVSFGDFPATMTPEGDNIDPTKRAEAAPTGALEFQEALQLVLAPFFGGPLVVPKMCKSHPKKHGFLEGLFDMTKPKHCKT